MEVFVVLLSWLQVLNFTAFVATYTPLITLCFPLPVKRYSWSFLW